ncbi:hypothetical protein B5G43_02570 [Flavonifractor sp. An92]|uniref:GrdX family protein n=1 Tax=Flavonifractor sp. An92 TaxID=1965666 RepID=UPI000B36CEEE|nr:MULTISPECIES: GrdX family protein [unclassified Flavonifractor]OUN08285.1 hypothetical protein B5G43_02570 [Flavonifractor sp. An92]OUQ25713.1 hypothetical protein B5E80_03755 [Flavonifractor sp. An135]
MGYTVVTNNVLCRDRFQGEYDVVYNEDWSYLDVLYQVRDLVQKGAILITHPMAGSLKPNQTPFRSVVIGTFTMEDKEPWEDIMLMENSIESCQKFLRGRPLPDYAENIKKDFRTLDLSFIEGAMARAFRCPGITE